MHGALLIVIKSREVSKEKPSTIRVGEASTLEPEGYQLYSYWLAVGAGNCWTFLSTKEDKKEEEGREKEKVPLVRGSLWGFNGEYKQTTFSLCYYCFFTVEHTQAKILPQIPGL